jgi:hypothetical protein
MEFALNATPSVLSVRINPGCAKPAVKAMVKTLKRGNVRLLPAPVGLSWKILQIHAALAVQSAKSARMMPINARLVLLDSISSLPSARNAAKAA